MKVHQKKGGVQLAEENNGLVIAILFIIVLIGTIYTLVQVAWAGYDPAKETLESYTTALERAHEEVKKYDISEISVIPHSEDGEYYLLAVFGDRNFFIDVVFHEKSYVQSTAAAQTASSAQSARNVHNTFMTDLKLSKNAKNTMCVCRVSTHTNDKPEKVSNSGSSIAQIFNVESSCRSCVNFDFPIEVKGGGQPVYDMTKYNFLLTKKAPNSQTKYVLEAERR